MHPLLKDNYFKMIWLVNYGRNRDSLNRPQPFLCLANEKVVNVRKQQHWSAQIKSQKSFERFPVSLYLKTIITVFSVFSGEAEARLIFQLMKLIELSKLHFLQNNLKIGQEEN
jgi:hypothetical protein